MAIKCPKCGSPKSKTIITRSLIGVNRIRRGKECQECGKAFTTIERIAKSEDYKYKIDYERA